MAKKEIYSHLLASLIYFLAVALLKWRLDFSLLWLFLGIVGGTFLLDIDHFIYAFVTHPEEEDSRQVRATWESKGIRGFKAIVGILLKGHKTHHRLVFHSAIGQVVLLAFAFYIISSGGSLFASAAIMAANLHLIKDEWEDLKGGNQVGLCDWLFWQVREIPVEKYLELYLVVVTIAFLLLSLLLRQ